MHLTKTSVGYCTGSRQFSHMDAGVLKVVGSQKFLNGLPQVFLQQPSDQLVVLRVQRDVYWRQDAMDGHIRDCMTQLPDKLNSL